MDIISDSVNLLHGVDQPTPAARYPTGDHDWILSGFISAFNGAKPSAVHTAEEAHDELDGGDFPPLAPEIPSVHAAVSHEDDARGGISTTEETSSEHDVFGNDDGAPVIHDFSASADSLVPPSSRRYSGEDSDSDSDDDLIILVNNEDQLTPSRPGQWCSPNYQTLNSIRSGAKRVVSQEKLSEYRKIIDREEKLQKEMAVLKNNIFFFEKNCRPKLQPPIRRPIPVECNSSERLPSAETKAMLTPRRLHSDVIIKSMRSGAKPVVPQEKLSEYRKIIDREEKLRKEMAVLKRNISFFEKNCRPKLQPPIGRVPIPVECSSTERLPSAETIKAMLPPRRLHSDVIIQIELQDIDFTTFINGAGEKADKDLKREGGEGDEEDRGIPSCATTKMEKKRKRDDSKVDDATGVHKVFCRPQRQRAVV